MSVSQPLRFYFMHFMRVLRYSTSTGTVLKRLPVASEKPLRMS
jgi:hypothetical protein